MRREPIFNAPSSVVNAIAALTVIHAVVWYALPDRLVTTVLELFAFIPARYTLGLGSGALGLGAMVWTPLTHQLLHGDWTHLLLNCAWLLVFGGAVATRIGAARFLALAVLSGVAGAAVFLALRFGDPVPMIGASGAVSGLMGGAFRFFFSALDRGGFEHFRSSPRSIPIMSVAEVLRDRRFQVMALAMVVINIVMSLGASAISSADGIAWQSHLGGFLFGLLAFQYFEPPKRTRPNLSVVPPSRPTLH